MQPGSRQILRRDPEARRLGAGLVEVVFDVCAVMVHTTAAAVVAAHASSHAVAVHHRVRRRTAVVIVEATRGSRLLVSTEEASWAGCAEEAGDGRSEAR